MKHLGTHFTHLDCPIYPHESDIEEGHVYWDDHKFYGPFSTRERMMQDMIIRTHVLPDLKTAWHGLRGHKMAAIKITLNGETAEMVVGKPIGWRTGYHRVDVSVRSVHQYFEGGLAQNIWPNLDIDDREFLISGILADNSEWKAMFASREDLAH